MSTLSKEKIQQLKLSAEESLQLNDFIGKAVRGNYKVTILTNKVGVSSNCGIQEVYNQTSDTLIIYAGILDKQIKGHTTNFDPLAEGELSYMVGKVKGEDLLSILKLIIREKAYAKASKERIDAMNDIQEAINESKTPQEKRAELEKQLALMQA